MVRPALFMLSIAVLYCVILFLFSCLISKIHLTDELISESGFETFNQVNYHSTISMDTRKSFYLNLDIKEPDIKKLVPPDESQSEITIESTLFNNLIYFHIENPNSFYIPSQVYLEQPFPSPKTCSLKTANQIISPNSSSKLGPLICKFPRADEYSNIIYLLSGEKVKKLNIKFQIRGPKINLNILQESQSKTTKKIQIENIANSSISITGVFFDNLLCYENHLEIAKCNEEFELLPHSSKIVELKIIEGFQGVVRSSLYISTLQGQLIFPVEICCFDVNDSKTLVVFLFFAVLLYYLNFVKLSFAERKFISVKEIEDFPSDVNKPYARPALLSKFKPDLKDINIKACRISDQFTMTSETTDTHLNSPTNSLNSEELALDDDYFLDSYKTSSLFSRNFCSSLLNSE